MQNFTIHVDICRVFGLLHLQVLQRRVFVALHQGLLKLGWDLGSLYKLGSLWEQSDSSSAPGETSCAMK